MERTSYSKLSQRDVDRAETDLLINLSTLTQRGLAKMIGCHESKISSPAKLRDKWTQLEINRNKQQAGVTAGKPKLDLTNTDWIYGVDL
ncbi:TPA: hypothetical protein OT828_002260 [Escherichia coli]|nr:hypothetical protein [Escherichia coli]